MAKHNLHKDGSGYPLQMADGLVVEKTITFNGGTTDAIGNDGGDQDPFTIFNVTGACLVKVFGVCGTNLAGATATLEVGVSGGTAGLIAQTTATDIDAGEVWHDASPDAHVEDYSNITQFILGNDQDIIGTVGTEDITAGEITFYCIYQPLSNDGEITAA